MKYNTRTYRFFRLLRTSLSCLFLVCLVFVTGCANRGVGPQGGPKDSIPPVAVKSEPVNGAVNFHGRDLEIHFNEYIQLDNIGQNLLMSPPQQTPPEVKARGKRVLVHFADSLRDSTTYTLDFGNAICDYTEKNPMTGYAFAFSTGPQIDTLEARGKVYDAENLNPLSGIVVGVHSDFRDTMFTSAPFDRIARTDSAGGFRIGNMKAGAYRLYAVDDISRDYRLTTGEALAFGDEPIAAPDTIEHTLFLFRPQQQRLYLQRALREQQHCIQLQFSASPDSMPSLRVMKPSELDSVKTDSGWIDPTPYILTKYSLHYDTLTLWLTDSIAIGIDSLFFQARYRRTDSINRLEWYTDTIRTIWRAPRLSAKAKEAEARKNRNRRLGLKSNARKGFDIFDTLQISCTTPLGTIEQDAFHLYERVDTLRTPVPFTLSTPDTAAMCLRIVAEWKPGASYELHVDSAAMHDIYGISHVATKYPLQVKTKEDYSTLRVHLKPYDAAARIQLLNNKDQVVRELPADSSGTFFPYLKPDAYYLRLYIDRNGDGVWTTGDWDEKRQPEPVYYLPRKIQTKSNWDFEEEWDYTASPQTETKPVELIKASSAKKK